MDSKNLFHITQTNLNTLKNLVLKKLDKLHHYPINNANCKRALNWWWIKSHKFLITTKFKKHILRILLSQIKMKRIFSIVGIFTSFYKCHPQTKNFKILIFVNKNCPLNPHIGYYKHSSLINAHEIEHHLTKELEAKFDDGMEYKEFLEVLWCHSSISLPNNGKHASRFLLEVFFFHGIQVNVKV